MIFVPSTSAFDGEIAAGDWYLRVLDFHLAGGVKISSTFCFTILYRERLPIQKKMAGWPRTTNQPSLQPNHKDLENAVVLRWNSICNNGGSSHRRVSRLDNHSVTARAMAMPASNGIKSCQRIKKLLFLKH